jgi:hypothetical protein
MKIRWFAHVAAGALLAFAPGVEADDEARAGREQVAQDQARMARVATGARVELARSARSAAEWSARRPGARELRPKPRGTHE